MRSSVCWTELVFFKFWNCCGSSNTEFFSCPFWRYALVDFGLAQGTADTQIELLKVVRQKPTQKGGGKQDNTQRGKAPHRASLKATTASTSPPGPPQQSTALPLPSSSSSSSTNNAISSSTASQKALVKRARSVTATVTSTCRTKHSKVSVLSQYFDSLFFLSVFGDKAGEFCVNCLCL